jgi:hypothetical protein
MGKKFGVEIWVEEEGCFMELTRGLSEKKAWNSLFEIE